MRWGRSRLCIGDDEKSHFAIREIVHSFTRIAVASLSTVVLGYLLIAGLWYFVFREKARRRRGRGPSD